MKEHLDNEFNRCGSGCSASSRHLKYKKGHSTKFVEGLKQSVCIFISRLAIFLENNIKNDEKPAQFQTERVFSLVNMIDRLKIFALQVAIKKTT